MDPEIKKKIILLSDFNPGAMDVLTQLVATYGVDDLERLEALGIVKKDIWYLYADCCKNSLPLMHEVLQSTAALTMLRENEYSSFYGSTGENRNPMEEGFEVLLAVERARAAQATGLHQHDSKYDQAHKVKQSNREGYVDVFYKEHWYNRLMATFGPLDGDRNKNTVVIQANDGLWYTLWFFIADIEKNS